MFIVMLHVPTSQLEREYKNDYILTTFPMYLERIDLRNVLLVLAVPCLR